MFFWLDLVSYILIVLLFINRKNKSLRPLLIGALALDLLILFVFTRFGLLAHVYHSVIYWSPTLILFGLPYLAYKNNWGKVKKSSVNLFFVMLGSFILFLIYGDVISPVVYSLVK